MISKSSDKIVTLVTCIAISFFIGMTIPFLTNFRGMGVLIQKLAPAFILITLFFVYKSGASFSLREFLSEAKTSFRWPYLLWTVLAALGWISISPYLSSGVVPALFSIFSIIGIFSSLFLLLFSTELKAFIVLFLTLPFIRFIEIQASGMELAGGLLGPIVITPSTLAILAFMLIYLLRKLTGYGHNTWTVSLGTKLYLLFVFFCLVSTFCSINIESSMIGFFIECLFFPSFYFICRSICRDDKTALSIFYAICGYVALRLIFSLYMVLRTDPNALGGMTHAVSQIEVLTTMATLAIPLSFGLFVLSNNGLTKIVAVVICLLAFVAIVVGDKREPIVALSLTLPFLFFLKTGYGTRVISVLVVMGLVASILFYSFIYQTHMYSIPTGIAELSFDYIRISAWFAGFRIVENFPFWGVGFGNFQSVLNDFAPKIFPNFTIWPLLTPHNFILHYLTSVGVLASVMLFSIIVYTFVMAIRIVKSSHNKAIKNVAVIVMWSFTCFLVAANTGGTMVPFAYSRENLDERILTFIPDFGILFWLFAGLVSAIYRFEIKSPKKATQASQGLVKL